MLELRHISKRFGDRQILSDISLNINKGEIAVSYTHLTLPTKIAV